jgi:hypothetical protein
MNIPEVDRLVRAGWTLRLVASSELYAHPFSAYLDGPPETDMGHAAVGSNAELALLQLEYYVSKQRPAQETVPAPEQSIVKAFERSPRRVSEPDCIKCADGKTDSHGLPLTASRMFLCPECGNKRCPKASNHELACTGSNEPGQPGSIYQV